jgi:hypothetical protein
MPSKRPLRHLRVPSDYIEWMTAVLPALRDLDPVDRQRLLWLVMDHEAEWRRHHAKSWCFIIPSVERERLFNKRFDDLLDASGLFDRQISYDYRLGQAAGFSLSPWTEIAHEEYLSAAPDLDPIDWIAGDGTVGRRLPAAVASRDVDDGEVKLWRGTSLPNAVRIDAEALQQRVAEYRAIIPILGNDHDRSHAKRRLRQCVRALRESHMTASTPGFLPHPYREVSTGRLAAIGLNGQSMSREVRAVAFQGYFDYDIENCHFSIVAQMCRRFGIPHPTIEAYSADKGRYRQPLCERYALTDDEVKKCILAVLYGATDSLYYRSAIPSLIGGAEAGQLFADPWFSALAKEVERIMHAVIDAWGLGAGGLIVNDASKGICPEEKPPKIFAHLLQGIEGKMLHTVCGAFPEDIVVAVHDGFISRSRLDTRQIERVIKAATGYDMHIVEKVLEPTAVEDHYKVTGLSKWHKPQQSLGRSAGVDLWWRNKDPGDSSVVELWGSPVAGSLPVGSGVTLKKLCDAAASRTHGPNAAAG